MSKTDEVLRLVAKYGVNCVLNANGFEVTDELARSRVDLRAVIEELVADAARYQYVLDTDYTAHNWYGVVGKLPGTHIYVRCTMLE